MLVEERMMAWFGVGFAVEAAGCDVAALKLQTEEMSFGTHGSEAGNTSVYHARRL